MKSVMHENFHNYNLILLIKLCTEKQNTSFVSSEIVVKY
jgi:hypothetical protein